LLFASASHRYGKLGRRRGAGRRLRYFLLLSRVRNADRAWSRNSPSRRLGSMSGSLGRRQRSSRLAVIGLLGGLTVLEEI